MKKLMCFLAFLPSLATAGVHVQQNDPNITIGSVTVTGAGIRFADNSVQSTAGGGGVYAATATASFPIGASFSTITVSGTGPGAISIIGNSPSFYYYNGSSVTLNGNSLLISTADPQSVLSFDDSNNANLNYNNWIMGLTGITTQASLGFDFLENTSGSVNALADGVGRYMWARDISINGVIPNGVLQGAESRVTGQGVAPQYLAHRFVAQWISPGGLQTGTTSEIVAGQFDVFITSVNGAATSTGTVIAIICPKWTGAGSPGHSWTFYGASTQPYFMDGWLGLGTAGPVAPLTVDVSTDTQYSVWIGTIPYLDQSANASQFTLKLSTDNILSTNPGLTVNSTSELKVVRSSPPNSSLDQAFHVDYERSVTGTGTRMSGIYSFVKSTGVADSPGNVAVGVYGEVDDTTLGNSAVEGAEGKALGKGLGGPYTGLVGRGEWRSSLTGGTTSTVEALNLVTAITDGSNNPISTGTLIILNIPAPTGSGAPNQSWTTFAPSTFPWFMDGNIGIGQSLPQSPLSIAVTTGTPFALTVTTIPYVDGGSTARNNILTLTSTGALTNVGSFNTRSEVILAGPTDTYEMTSSSSSNFNHVAISTSGHFLTGGQPPVISACGTTPNGAVVGDDNEGTITIGGGVVTACTLTFANTWGATPTCVVSDNSTGITGDISALSATAMTMSFSSTIGSGTVYYRCGCSGSACR